MSAAERGAAAPETPGRPAVRLGARGITRRFGSLVANDRIDLAVAPGTIHAIVGGNGAGKTTLMRLLQGVDGPDEGTIILDDRPIAFAGPADAFAKGVGMVHQEFMLVPELTLLENLILANEPVRFGGVIDRRRAEKAAAAIAQAAGVSLDWDTLAANAPVHVRQVVEILRLLHRGADVLIFDEPTSVLAPPQVRDFLAMMRRLKAEGRTILFISHKLGEVLSVADRITVLRSGRVVATTTPGETNVAALAGLMVGGEVAAVAARSERPPAGTAVVSIAGLAALSRRGIERLGGIDLDLHAHEIVGVAGVAGSGQDELVACCAGLARPIRGTIRLAGTDATRLTIGERRRLGLAYVSADRGGEGLSLAAPIRDNAVAGHHRRSPFCSGPLLSPRRIGDHVHEALQRFSVVHGRMTEAAASLSGGNQQRVVIARELAFEPCFLIAAQPTRGVDIRGTAFIHQEILAFRDRGGAVLLVSEELDELLALSDRIVVLFAGRIAADLPVAAATPDRIGHLMLGAAA